MPDESKYSFEPLLPNLTFKVRTGDSLVQRIGNKTFPVQAHVTLSPAIERRIRQLEQKKRDFFDNKIRNYRIIEQEELAVFLAILDEEIAKRKRQIKILDGPRHEQQAIPELLDPSYEQTEIDFAEETDALLKQLEAEIVELQNQKHSLKDEHPFIWSIQFAEIFLGRGGFDIIIGNPPYVRQEDISDPNRNLEPQNYKDALYEMLRYDFPGYFAKSRAELDKFRPGRRPSGRSDLYTHFYIRSLRLLNSDGVHVFICSNSWLDVDYGTWLQEFFLRKAPLYFVIDNHARRSFVRADINTVITVAGAPRTVREDHIVRFVAFKQPFEEVLFSENLLASEEATSTVRDERFRIVPVSAGELLWEGSEVQRNLSQVDNRKPAKRNLILAGKYTGDKWQYLRAPDIFFTILKRAKINWCA